MKLIFDNVSKAYGSNKALTGFTATLEPGIYALLGPNGSGKTTLMNILTDNLKADSGKIYYSDGDEEPRDIREMGAEFRELLGFMPQYPGMYPNFTVERFLWYMAALKDLGNGMRRRDRKKYVAECVTSVLKAVELDDAAHRKIGALSGGMKQRLALAQAVLGDPKILILDEPTAGLDPRQRITVRNFISRIAFDKIVLIATHVVSDVEFTAREVIMLRRGVIVDRDAPGELEKKVEGKVWTVRCGTADVPEIQKKYRVVNISRAERSADALLRIISDETPEGAEAAAPTLEDYYLYVFADAQGEDFAQTGAAGE